MLRFLRGRFPPSTLSSSLSSGASRARHPELEAFLVTRSNETAENVCRLVESPAFDPRSDPMAGKVYVQALYQLGREKMIPDLYLTHVATKLEYAALTGAGAASGSRGGLGAGGGMGDKDGGGGRNSFAVGETLGSVALSVVKTMAFWVISLSAISLLFKEDEGDPTKPKMPKISPPSGGMGGLFMSTPESFLVPQKSTVRFSDVKGVDEAKEELTDIVKFLKNPTQYAEFGGTMPKGILMTGPPGTGKTLLAKAIAGEAGVPFFAISASEIEEMFVGVGASRIRKLFQAARSHKSSLIFIDEIDAIGGNRNPTHGSSHRASLNQLLAEMDGFSTTSGVIVIGATNTPEYLDSALLRPGRFDTKVAVPLPDVNGRKEILDLYTKKLPKIADDVDTKVLARGTPGCSGADLYHMVNVAAIYAVNNNLDKIDMKAFEHAKDKVLMGPERKSRVLTSDTIRKTACHEAGHALVSLLTPLADPVYKATVMPRGGALGFVMQLPEGDQVSITKGQLLARMDVCMGGRVAEEIFFGDNNVSTGAESDFSQATNIARSMVTKWGMSEVLGVEVWKNAGGESNVSDATRALIDKEVVRLLDDSYKRAKSLLLEHRDKLTLIADSLEKNETLSGNELKQIIQKGSFERDISPSR